MNQLQVINHLNQRVLTTAQLAESFGADTKQINNNFGRNKNRYSEGKHYFELRGNELELFKASHQIDDNLKFAPVVHLWTEKGAWMHAKSLNTDEAWEAYEMLVDDYYSVKSHQIDTALLSPELQMFKQIFDGVAKMQLEQAETQQKLQMFENRIDTLTTGLTATPDHTKVVARVNELARWSRMGHNEVYNKIYDILKAKHGIDVRQRVENERYKINVERFNSTGKYYAESTLKSRVNGIDVMVRMGVLDKFNEILVGMLTRAKGA